MNRLRILKQRIARSGDVSVCKLSNGYVVASGRFQGDASPPMSKRSAIHLAARWAMPSRPQTLLVKQNGVETKVETHVDGRCVVSITDSNGRPILTDYPAG